MREKKAGGLDDGGLTLAAAKRSVNRITKIDAHKSDVMTLIAK
jgi:hypothetical protein